MNKIINSANEKNRQLTREAICEALYILLNEEKDINNIKIVNLVKKAGVSRSAFYRNYNSIEDVLKSSINSNINNIIKSFNNNLSNNWKVIIQYFKNNKNHFITLYKSGYFYLLLDQFNEQVENDNYYLLGWNGFIYNILLKWVKNDMKESDKELHSIIIECTKKMATVINDNKIY